MIKNEDLLSREEAYLFNERNILQIALWTHEEKDIIDVFSDRYPDLEKRPSSIKKLMRWMNNETTRVTMCWLVRSVLRKPSERPPPCSLRALANVLDPERSESMQHTLRSSILPCLSDAGYIEDAKQQDENPNSPHQIVITDNGINAMLRYYHRVKINCDPIEDELHELNHSQVLGGLT